MNNKKTRGGEKERKDVSNVEIGNTKLRNNF